MLFGVNIPGWLLFAAGVVGIYANIINLRHVTKNYFELQKQGRNGKEKAMLWQRCKDELSILLLLLVFSPAPFIDTSSPLFVFLAVSSLANLSYVSLSRWQSNNILTLFIREATDPHKTPAVALMIDSYKRRVDELEATLKRETAPEPVKLLVVGAWVSPLNMPPLDLPKDFKGFMNSGGAWDYVSITENVTVAHLEERLNDQKRPIDAFYFDGHSGPEGLYLEDACVPPRWVADLFELNKVRLVILASCKGAKIARALRRAEMPVVFMQKSISDKSAMEATKALLGAFADGQTLDYAVKRARLRIREVDMINYFGDKDFRLSSN